MYFDKNTLEFIHLVICGTSLRTRVSWITFLP